MPLLLCGASDAVDHEDDMKAIQQSALLHRCCLAQKLLPALELAVIPTSQAYDGQLL